MGRHAEQGKDFTIVSQPDQPIIAVVPMNEEHEGWNPMKLASVLAELRERFSDKQWQVVPSKLRKIDTGSGLAMHEISEYLVISFDPL